MTLNDMSDIKANKNSSCCSNPQQSVLVGVGTTKNISAEDVEEWLKEKYPSTKFVHVKKSLDKGYGHVHFFSEQDAASFYHTMQSKRFNGPKGCQVSFRAAKHFNGDLVVYPQPNQNHQTPSSPSSPVNEDQYSITKKGGVFIIVVNTPGITFKDQVKISVGDDDDDIEIIGELPQYESAQFNIEIKLPEKIDSNSDVKINVGNEETTFEFKIKKSSKKRKFLNIS